MDKIHLLHNKGNKPCHSSFELHLLNNATLFDKISLDKIGNKSVVLKICLFTRHSKRDFFAVINLKIGGSSLHLVGEIRE